MKKLFTILFFFTAFVSNAQRSMFGGQNNYVAPVGPPALVTAGLVLNLDAGNLSSYSGTGTTWTDLSGRGNHGTLVNSVTYSSSNQGSLLFDANGTNDGSKNPYVQLPMSTDFDFGTEDFTVEMWVYTSSGSPHPNLMTINANTNGNSYVAIRMEYWNGNLGILHSYDGNSHASVSGSSSFPFTLNVWSHIVMSRISGAASVYVNGVLKASYSLPGSLLAQQNTRIGGFYPYNGYYSHAGNIAVTRFYKGRGLTSSEALTHFDLTKTRFGL
jgi:hypothetical protein